MNNFDTKVAFSRLICLVKEFGWQKYSWKDQSWQVKSCIMFGGCAVFLILRRISMAISGKICKRPPQLYGLPLVGSVITMQIWKDHFRRKTLPKYGDIVIYNSGITNMYVINDLQLLNAVFRKAVDRNQVFENVFLSHNKEVPLISANNDRDWSRRRKIAMTSITKIMNKKELEDRVSLILQEITYKELNSLLLKNKNNNGYAIWYPRNCLKNAVFNVIYFASFGKTVMIDDDLYKKYNRCISDFPKYGIDALLTDVLGGIIAGIFGFRNGERKFASCTNTLYQLVEEEFTQLIDNITKNKNEKKGITKGDELKGQDTNTIAQCMYETFVMDNPNGIMDKEVSDRCVADLAILLIGGVDTTGHSSEVGILLLAKHPQIQEKLYKELCNEFETDSGDNNDRFKFTFDKIHKCVLFRAFVNEALRIACAVPNGVSRAASKELRCIKWTKNNGKTFDVICEERDNKKYDFDKIVLNKKNKIIYDYLIESGAEIEPNFGYLFLANKQVWNKENNPEDLNLNYWLKKNVNNGKITFKNNLNSTPFSVGKIRDCLGQSLARKELLAFLANLILNYKIEAQNGDASSVNIKYTLGSTHSVDPQIPVRISKR